MMQSMNRRAFLEGVSAAGLCSATGGCAAAGFSPAHRVALPETAWGFLAHLGTKMWEKYADNSCVTCDFDVWREVTDRLPERGVNVLVVDLGEALRYPSRPELGLVGAWEPERMRDEIARLKRNGVMAVPKLNFSTGHDQWLGRWRRYVSTPEYYEVCAGLVGDVAEIFEEAPVFHFGFDEETYYIQNLAKAEYVRLRTGSLWWHDCLWLADEIRRTGMRPWMWSDYGWSHRDEFLTRMPKDILQSNWYYGRSLDREHLAEVDRRDPGYVHSRVEIVALYRVLEEHGFDQMPTGSTYRKDSFQTQNFAEVIKFARTVISPTRLKGFLMAPWLVTTRQNRERLLTSVDLVADARNKLYERRL